MKQLFWFIAFLVLFVLNIPFQLWLQRMHKADSIGMWYTLYRAFVPSFIFVGTLYIVTLLIRTIYQGIRHRLDRGSSQR